MNHICFQREYDHTIVVIRAELPLRHSIYFHIYFFRFRRYFFSCEKNAWQFNFELSCCCCKLSSFKSRWFSDFRFLSELNILWEGGERRKQNRKKLLDQWGFNFILFYVEQDDFVEILCLSNFLITLFYDRSLWGFMAATQWYTRK